MIKALLCAAVTGVIALSGASVANAAAGEAAPIDIRMTLDQTVDTRQSVDANGTHWQSRGPFDFSVRLTDVGEANEQGVTVFLSVPDALDVQSWGDGWSCEDTEGGVDCHHADLVVPGEAWPELYFRAQPTEYVFDTIDVYATTGDYEATHEGVSYYLNAST
ncbi:hypothetical protein SK854_12895 [Lentzea sp. BCCO 10_0061]|uniref:Uncharacterized protein n=1 Tax=Lentzea sokolovensis TaxID=3095429 RepID=A0ABU4UU31_9PSEU|nr:hypothetical protein [Lentzea sp. BCCO 10_0061]MDX8143017.1 hypothetical protein [Lentzea sp. BCCO 10_0061]